MRLIDLKPGQMCTRDWYSKNAKNPKELCILCVTPGVEYHYIENGVFQSVVIKDSSVFRYNDYVLVKNYKDKAMKIEDIKILLLCYDVYGNHVKQFASEKDAHEFIEEHLELNPLIRYVLYKPYQKVGLPKASIKNLITKV